jgi:hypothetical protein
MWDFLTWWALFWLVLIDPPSSEPNGPGCFHIGHPPKGNQPLGGMPPT